MTPFLVVIDPVESFDRNKLRPYFLAVGKAYRIREGAWVVMSALSADGIFDQLEQLVRKRGTLAVFEIKGAVVGQVSDRFWELLESKEL